MIENMSFYSNVVCAPLLAQTEFRIAPLSPESLLFLIISGIVALMMAVYAIGIYNHFAALYEQLRGLAAFVAGQRLTGKDINRAVGGYVQTATGHAVHLSRASQGYLGGKLVLATSQRYPEQRAISTVEEAMSYDLKGIDSVQDARRRLNDLATQYNAELRHIPKGYVARLMGFCPWYHHESRVLQKQIRRKVRLFRHSPSTQHRSQKSHRRSR